MRSAIPKGHNPKIREKVKKEKIIAKRKGMEYLGRKVSSGDGNIQKRVTHVF